MSKERISQVLHELIEEWHATSVPVEMSVRQHILVGLSVYGLTAHTYTAVAGALTLHEANQPTAAIPLARQALECATTAVWVELCGYPAALALLYDQARNRKNAVAQFAKSGSDIEPEFQEQLSRELEREFRSSTNAGKKFEERCGEIAGGDGLYAIYRALSATSHAGSAVVDLYTHKIKATDTNQLGLALSTRPKVAEVDMNLGILLTSLVTATSAWSRLDKKRTHQTRMKLLNQELGTTFEKRLSNHGFVQSQVRERELKGYERAARERDQSRRHDPSE